MQRSSINTNGSGFSAFRSPKFNNKKMQHKVKSITEKVPQVTTLPDGLYHGTWGGYVVDIDYKGKKYELSTEEGVRGIGIKVVVEIKDGVATFDTVRS